MKANYFLRSLLAVMLMGLVTNVSAKEITVSGDTDADIRSALSEAADGDVIYLTANVINVNSAISVDKNVKFIGNGSNYFDGQGSTKIFEVVLPEEIVSGQYLGFQDIGFVAGFSDTDGGAIRISSGSVVFNRCFFEENVSLGQGGAVCVEGEGTTVRFYECETDGNVAAGPGGTSRGGFMYTVGEVNTIFEYCKITGNICEYDRGGAFYLNGGNHRFFSTAIHSNTSGKEGEGDERGGAAFTVNGQDQVLTLEACAVSNNVSYGLHGAAFFLMDKMNVTLINTSVVNNWTTEGAGSWFITGDDIDITLVNVTMVGNKGTNSGNSGGGMHFTKNGARLNVFNSIIIGNETENEGAVDIGIDGKVSNGAADFVFKNSIVGLIGNADRHSLNANNVFDNPAISNPSLINMYNLVGEDAQPDWNELDVSGVDISSGLQNTTRLGLRYYTLKDNNVYAANLGDPELLFGDYEIDEDMFRVQRNIAADGSIFAGAVQSVTGNTRIDDKEIPTIDLITVGIKDSYADSQEIKLNSVVNRGGLLGIDFGDLKGKAKGELVSLSGQVVETVFDLPVVGKGVYAINAEPGMYILKITIEGKTVAKKLIVK
ncbi:MAG: T9SS type A sorting domain-containing protein [Candidatus Azobacteroides sp.]|nr:T9SS type A sorting domain-containing protein [Candidatus Azobacteroides sp.]